MRQHLATMSAIMLPGRFTAILQVIRTSDWPELDSKRRPNAKSTGQLREELAPLLGQTTLRPSGQELIIGAALLWHDHLEAAHTIAQQTDTTDGSLLHGMMHRRGFRLRQRQVLVPAGEPTPLLSDHRQVCDGISPRSR